MVFEERNWGKNPILEVFGRIFLKKRTIMSETRSLHIYYRAGNIFGVGTVHLFLEYRSSQKYWELDNMEMKKLL